MNNYLPWISLGVACLAVLLRDGVRSPRAKGHVVPAGAYVIVVLLVAAAMLAGWKWSTLYEGLFPAVSGFSIGALLAAVAYGVGLLPGQAEAGKSAPIALAAAAVGFASWFPDKAAMCLVFGAAAGAWVLSIGKTEDPNPWAMRSAVAAGAIVACNLLASKANLVGDSAHVGTWLAVGAVVAGILAGFLRAKSSGLALICAFGLFAAAIYGVCTKLQVPPISSVIIIASAAIAMIVAWLIPEAQESRSARLAIASVIWIAAATAVFGFEKGFGMALALLGAVAMLLLAGNRQALLSLAPLAALVFYRVFREAHPDTSHGFDISQHYAILGVLLGAILPIMAQEWLRLTGKRGGGAALVAGGLWVLLLAAAPVVVAIALSSKGIIGYLIGLGIAPVMEGARGERSALSLALSMGLGSMMALLYDWLTPHLDLARHEKLIALAWVGGAAVVAACVIAMLSSDYGKASGAVAQA